MTQHFKVYYVPTGSPINFLHVQTTCVVLDITDFFLHNHRWIANKLQSLMSSQDRQFLKFERVIYPF